MVEKTPVSPPEEEEEYEILPHKEIKELKEELAKLKEFEITPTKKMEVSLLELNTKLDKLLTIFEDAMHELRVEEGGLSFAEKMRPLLEKMSKILEQNSEIASGILALADMVKELKGEKPAMPAPAPTFETPFEMPSLPPIPPAMPPPPIPPSPIPKQPITAMPAIPPPPMPPTPPAMPPPPFPVAGPAAPGVPPGLPLPPVRRRRTFGL